MHVLQVGKHSHRFSQYSLEVNIDLGAFFQVLQNTSSATVLSFQGQSFCMTPSMKCCTPNFSSVCRETDLLYSANESSIQNERRVAVVIAHEMVHQVSKHSSNAWLFSEQISTCCRASFCPIPVIACLLHMPH